MSNGFFVAFAPDELIWHTEYHADHDMAFGDEHPPFPAPGGLIPWSNNEHQEHPFHTAAEGVRGHWFE